MRDVSCEQVHLHSATYLLPLLFIQLLELIIEFEQVLGNTWLQRSARSEGRALWHVARWSDLLLLCILHLRRRNRFLSRWKIISHIVLIRLIRLTWEKTVEKGSIVHICLIAILILVRLLTKILLKLLLHSLLHLLNPVEILGGRLPQLMLGGG